MFGEISNGEKPMMDAVFKALADPTRRGILRLLERGEMTAGDIASHFEIGAPSMSHHFNVLKNADLVRARREGQQIHYALNTTVFQDLMGVVFELLKRDGSPEEGSR
jgi:ArsR family transcriptional regulator